MHDIRVRVLHKKPETGPCALPRTLQVRIAACKAACAVALAHPSLVPDTCARPGSIVKLDDVSIRMRDLKPAVRRAAALALLGVFRARVLQGRRVGVVRSGAHPPQATRPAAPHMQRPASALDASSQGAHATISNTSCPVIPTSPGGLAAVSGIWWIPTRAAKCACADSILREDIELFWRDGLLGPAASPVLVAQVGGTGC